MKKEREREGKERRREGLKSCTIVLFPHASRKLCVGILVCMQALLEGYTIWLK